MSVMEAPPVASAGLPKKPWKNLRTTKPAKLLISDSGIVITRKMKKVTIYGGFLPITGISLIGEKTKAPRPYASTYMDRPKLATVGLMLNFSIKVGIAGV